MSSALCDCSPPAPFVRHNKRTRRCRLQLGCRSKVALGSIGTVWRTSTITFDFGWRSEVGSIALVQPVAVACGNLFVDRDESFRETTPLQTRFYFSGVIISFCNLVLLNFLAKANSRYFNDPSTSRGSIIIYDFSLNFQTIHIRLELIAHIYIYICYMQPDLHVYIEISSSPVIAATSVWFSITYLSATLIITRKISQSSSQSSRYAWNEVA